LPAEKVRRLHAQPDQQRQKQDQGNFSISVARPGRPRRWIPVLMVKAPVRR
jgi:hypothetical protein